MQELTFVGLSEDGSKLLLALQDGRRYALPIDERLRAATRGSARPGQMMIPTDAGRPRDVQARLRAGATAEEVADSSGWPLSRVEAFAVPVMQERSYVAERARGSMIRFLDGELSLEEVVAHRLAERAVDVNDFRWDAWRGEDGRWTVLLAYPAGRGDQVATWSFDLESRTLQPLDEEAGWLSEHQEPVVEADDPDPQLFEEADEPTAQVVSLPAKEDRAAEAEGSRHPALRRQQEREQGATPLPTGEPPEAAGADEAAAERSRSKRATVPSWDEILFGGSGEPDSPGTN